jgi:hypothetical protein
VFFASRCRKEFGDHSVFSNLEAHSALAERSHSAHTRIMTLKNSAVLALIGMTLLSVLLTALFIRNLVALTSDAIPVVAVLSSLVHAFAALSVAVFFYFFQRAQG